MAVDVRLVIPARRVAKVGLKSYRRLSCSSPEKKKREEEEHPG